MLRLASATDPAWAAQAADHLDDTLVDHAHCEHKAAVSALALVSRYPDDPVLVEKLSALARDEASHLARAAAFCHARGRDLGHPEQDAYVKELLRVMRTDPLGARVDRLVVSAFIEARSCERLHLLADELRRREAPADLVAFYDELWREEATHHVLFLQLAERSLERAGHKGASGAVAARVAVVAAHEAAVLAALPLRPRIH
jgi:tRNA-(ms[2]io[6]A)-hydroxylase